MSKGLSSRNLIEQRGVKDNAYIAVYYLVKMLRLKITDLSLIKLKDHPEYPSLSSITDSLFNWGIDNITINSTLEQLKEIPYPAIAHLSKNGGHFVVLQKLEGDNLHYIDPEIGFVKEPLSDFEKKWTGVVLLVEANEKSGEEGYKEKHRNETFSRWGGYLVWGLAPILLVLPTFFSSPTLLPYYFLKIIGAGFCFLLLQKQFGSDSKALASFCRMGSKSNCDAVIQSAESKLFGVIHLSEIGFLYFVGGILSLALASFSGSPIDGLTASLSFIAFPFTFVSVYYQWKVVKAWCPLCLLVMVVIWLEALALIPLLSSVSFSAKAITISFMGFSLPLIFWLATRQRFIDSYRIPNLERSLYRFTHSDKVFQSLLANQPKVDMENLAHEIETGNPDAPVVLTLVSNPTCGPCSAAHAAVEDLLERFEGKIKVNFRFTVNLKEPESISNKMVKHIISLSLTEPQKCNSALSDWYLLGGRADIGQWMKKNPIRELNGEEGKVNLLLSEHANWCTKAGITATPTLFINGKKYPDEYSLSDLRFQICKLLESIPEPSPIF